MTDTNESTALSVVAVLIAVVPIVALAGFTIFSGTAVLMAGGWTLAKSVGAILVSLAWLVTLAVIRSWARRSRQRI